MKKIAAIVCFMGVLCCLCFSGQPSAKAKNDAGMWQNFKDQAGSVASEVKESANDMVDRAGAGMDVMFGDAQVYENFTWKIVATGLESPWEMLWGPDNMLWVTERRGKSVTRVNPKTGEKKPAVEITEVFVGPQHEGILGIAFGPGMTAAKGNVFITYTYKEGNAEFQKVVRLDYDGKSGRLINPVDIIKGIPAGNDHQGGRLAFDSKGLLYLSKGELGNNQFGNFCKPIEAQRLPTAGEIAAKDYSAYVGKILRMTQDGGIPADNPILNGAQSHVYTYGHRNPQGLVFVGDRLFSSEQGPSSDDEINMIVKGGNYGWPHVAGFQDNLSYRYANYSAASNCRDLKFDPNVIPAGVPVQLESEWPAPGNFQPPAKTFYTVPPGYNFTDKRCLDAQYLCWPTISPGSIIYYPKDGPIPGWQNSLLVTSLKNGALYKMRLSDDQAQIQGDVQVLFHTANRYRVACLRPDKKAVYIATDSSGQVMDENGIPTGTLKNPGAIIMFEYE